MGWTTSYWTTRCGWCRPAITETVEAPIIFLNHDPKVYPRCYHINFDYRAAMVAALRHMVSLGHRNILVITPKENPYTNRLVLETCKLFYKQNHMVFPDENLVEIETYLFRTLALENLDQVLGTLQSRGITGIITTEMMATMHVVDYLQHQGVTMPPGYLPFGHRGYLPYQVPVF